MHGFQEINMKIMEFFIIIDFFLIYCMKDYFFLHSNCSLINYLKDVWV